MRIKGLQLTGNRLVPRAWSPSRVVAWLLSRYRSARLLASEARSIGLQGRRITDAILVRSHRRSAVKFRVLIDQDEDGVFVAQVPSLPGCITQGATRQEAVSNAQEAIEAYLESLNEQGDPIPPSISEELVDVAV